MKAILFLILAIGLFLSIVIPFLAGYDTFGLEVRGWIIVSTVAGAGLFCLAYSETPIISLICGLILGLVMQMSSFYYFNLLFKNRETFLRIEILIPIVLGAVSGISLYNLYLNLAGKSNTGKQEEKP